MEPQYLPYETLAALRPERSVPLLFAGLWCCGSIEGLRRPCVAVVGTRSATAYGTATARRFASELARAGCCVISGLALGIDSAAHEGALEAQGATVGVLGGGHNCFFPARNRALGTRIVECGGAVLSPFPPEQQAKPLQFLQRNGIVAALADAVVVVEAPARSGALNTAGWAAGRIPVFAVPGDVDRAHVAGCHALIRDGAILARSAADVIADSRLQCTPGHEEPVDETAADPVQRRILEALNAGETSLDALAAAVDEPLPNLLTALSLLELHAKIETRAGGRYALR